MGKHVIRNLVDLVDVDPQHLDACLRALRAEIRKVSLLPPDARGPLVFEWNTPEPHVAGAVARADTAIIDLGLSFEAQQLLSSQGICFVEDLAEVPKSTIEGLAGIGPKSLEVLRRAMTGAGLCFLGEVREVDEFERSRIARAVPVALRRATLELTGASKVCDLGLTPSTLQAVWAAGAKTVAELQKLTKRSLQVHFSRREAREAYLALKTCDFHLLVKLSELEKFDLGILQLHEMPFPKAGRASVATLAPWLPGSAIRKLERLGIRSLAGLRKLVATDDLPVKGLSAADRALITHLLRGRTKSAESQSPGRRRRADISGLPTSPRGS